MIDARLPVYIEHPDDRDDALDDIRSHIIEVTHHDQDDIVFERRYIVLFVEDTPGDQILASTTSTQL